MSKFFKSKLFIILAVITVLCIVLGAVSAAVPSFGNPLRNAVNTVLSPIERIFTGAAGGVSGFFSGIVESREYKQKYENAETELRELQKDEREKDKLQNENESLRALLDLQKEKSEHTTVAAAITSKDPVYCYSDFIINKGDKYGIAVNQAVITEDGLVGVISETGATWSRVSSILDSAVSVGCVATRSGDMAITEGDATLAQISECRMDYISKDASIAAGDSIETSGYSSIYPEGILIGKIEQINPDLQGLYNRATVKTAVDFAKLKYVLVIIK